MFSLCLLLWIPRETPRRGPIPRNMRRYPRDGCPARLNPTRPASWPARADGIAWSALAALVPSRRPAAGRRPLPWHVSPAPPGPRSPVPVPVPRARRSASPVRSGCPPRPPPGRWRPLPRITGLRPLPLPQAPHTPAAGQPGRFPGSPPGLAAWGGWTSTPQALDHPCARRPRGGGSFKRPPPHRGSDLRPPAIARAGRMLDSQENQAFPAHSPQSPAPARPVPRPLPRARCP